jgi:hypothetical protein
VSQTPIHSSKIDFEIRTPNVIKARNKRPTLEDVMEEQWENTQMSNKPNKMNTHEPKLPQGVGAESKGLYLKLHKEELERGVFVSSHKSPILSIN